MNKNAQLNSLIGLMVLMKYSRISTYDLTLVQLVQAVMPG
jgi:hypothetical protein